MWLLIDTKAKRVYKVFDAFDAFDEEDQRRPNIGLIKAYVDKEAGRIDFGISFLSGEHTHAQDMLKWSALG